MMSEAAKIFFFADHAPSDQHLIGTYSRFEASPLCCAQYPWREKIPKAVKFESRAGFAMAGKVVVARNRKAKEARDGGRKGARRLRRARACEPLDRSRIPSKCPVPHGHSTATPRNKRHSPQAWDGL